MQVKCCLSAYIQGAVKITFLKIQTYKTGFVLLIYSRLNGEWGTKILRHQLWGLDHLVYNFSGVIYMHVGQNFLYRVVGRAGPSPSTHAETLVSLVAPRPRRSIIIEVHIWKSLVLSSHRAKPVIKFFRGVPTLPCFTVPNLHAGKPR